MKICFITSLFGKQGHIDNVSKFERIEGHDYFLFTDVNPVSLDTSWDIINIGDHEETRKLGSAVMKSRFPKFLGWKLIKDDYDMVVYCDAFFSPSHKYNWKALIDMFGKDKFNFIQNFHHDPSIRDVGIFAEMKVIVKAKKDTQKSIDKTMDFFTSHYPDINFEAGEFITNKTFCYDPKDPLVRKVTEDFWNIYTNEIITFRDQPLWNLIILKNKVKPIIFRSMDGLFTRSGKSVSHVLGGYNVNTTSIFVTGCCGFIGTHLVKKLLSRGFKVYGIDNMNDYYDTSLKEANLKELQTYERFIFKKDDVRTTKMISEWKPDKICHLAAAVGVRHSLENPSLYTSVNIDGIIHVFEEAKNNGIKDITYASSSSVYGTNKKVPFSESDELHSCVSPYASSKLESEIHAQKYSKLYGLGIIGLRFFTVYGPGGRPDMMPHKVLSALAKDMTFQKYGDGTSSRDYTYVDDIVAGICASICKVKNGHEVYNLGNSDPTSLNTFIEICENVVGKTAIFKQVENQPGDVPTTYADISKAKRDLGYSPKTKLKDGLTLMYKSMQS